MHPAAQVEPQIHRPRIQRAEPLRRRRQQGEGDAEPPLRQLAPQRLARAQLGVTVGQADFNSAVIQGDGGGGNLLIGENRLHPLQIRRAQRGPARAANLHPGIIAEQIGKRV